MMFAYYFFKDVQSFFEKLHKNGFLVFFDCKEEGLLNIRILYNSDKFEILLDLFREFQVDRKSFIEFACFNEGKLTIRYSFLGVEK